MTKNKTLAATLALVGLTLTAGPAQALITWSFSSGGCVDVPTGSETVPGGCGGWNTQATYAGTADGTVTGESATQAVVRALQNQAASQPSPGKLQFTATQHFSGGLGAAPDLNGDGTVDRDGWSPSTSNETVSPFHAIENSYDNFEFVLIDVGQLIALSQITVGYVGTGTNWGDSDITVLAYTGAGGGVGTELGDLDLTSKFFSDLNNANGWQVVGNYADVAVGTKTINNGATTYESRWWAIGAYNPVFGTGPGLGHGTCTQCTPTAWDSFKLASAAGARGGGGGEGQPVPTPGVVGLLGLGLALMGWQRRRFSA
jgi:hypothetical protein